MARPNCLRLLTHCSRRAASRAAWTAGSKSAISTAMIAITTSSSIRVKPRRTRDPTRLPCPLESFAAGIGHPPDGPGAVVRDHERAVLGDRDTHRPTPDVAVLGHESDQEIL